MSDDKGKSWSERYKQREAEKAARQQQEAAKPVAPTPTAPANPTLPENGPLTAFEIKLPENVQESDKALDSLIDSMDFKDAYMKFSGKMTPNPLPGQVESIMIRCPDVDHVDNNPSAWYNSDTKLWHCEGCLAGGDILELVALARGYGKDYKTDNNGKAFNDVRREVGKAHGWTFEPDAKGFILGYTPEQQAERARRIEAELLAAKAADQGAGLLVPLDMGTSTSSAPVATTLPPVVDIQTGEEVEQEEPYDPNDFEINRGLPKLDWRSLAKEGTFLDEYMKAAIVDQAPEEFHFFNGLMALGLGVGRTVWCETPKGKFYSNLFVCALGSTSLGKSTALKKMKDTLSKALEYDHNDIERRGVWLMPKPASGEVIVDMFKGMTRPPKTQGQVPHPTGRVKGMIEFDEFREFFTKASRQGSVIKDTIQGLFDSPDRLTGISRTHGEDIATDVYGCISTGVQPDVLRSIMGKDDSASGFINRFLFVTGHYKPEQEHEVKADMSLPAEILKDINTWAQHPVMLTNYKGELVREPDAAKAEFEWRKNVWEPLKTRKAASDTFKRADFYLKKFSMLFAINDMSDTITLEHWNKALALYPFIMETYSIIDTKINMSETAEMEEDILAVIKKMQPQGGVKWITAKAIKRVRRGYELNDIDRCLVLLERTDHLTGMMNPPKTGPGRPIKGMGYVPA